MGSIAAVQKAQQALPVPKVQLTPKIMTLRDHWSSNPVLFEGLAAQGSMIHLSAGFAVNMPKEKWKLQFDQYIPETNNRVAIHLETVSLPYKGDDGTILRTAGRDFTTASLYTSVPHVPLPRDPLTENNWPTPKQIFHLIPNANTGEHASTVKMVSQQQRRLELTSVLSGKEPLLARVLDVIGPITPTFASDLDKLRLRYVTYGSTSVRSIRLNHECWRLSPDLQRYMLRNLYCKNEKRRRGTYIFAQWDTSRNKKLISIDWCAENEFILPALTPGVTAV
jgi:hypothetical protein